jgi:PAS domain S-box-containing protein
MNSKIEKNIPKFLQNGGEMAQIIADKDWTSHPLGIPENWPIALKLTLGNLLKNSFPKFLFWGEEFFNFYNDAYRPSLGVEGKHPFIIGQKFDEAWPELKDTLKLVAEKVYQTGEPSWFENQLVPIFRNGKIEDVYWTFSYSVVLGDTMEFNGVAVTCMETTEAVKNFQRLKENENELKFAIEAADLGTWDFDPLHDKLKTNQRLKSWFGLPVTEEIELSQATVAIIEKDRSRVSDTIQKVLTGETDGKYDIIYTIQNKQSGQQRIVRAVGKAWFNEDNVACRFNGTLQDITTQQKSINKLKIDEERFRRLVKEIPVGIVILSVENYVINLVNDMALFIWQKTTEETHNKPLFEVLTAIKDGILPIFEEIIKTKKPSKGLEYPFKLERNGVKETGYFNFIFEPVIENNQVIEIMLVAFEVTETVKARFILEQSEKQFKNFVMQSPVAMGILRGDNMIVEMANNTLLNLFWRTTHEEATGKGLLELFPSLSDSKYPTIIRTILKTGIAVSEKESYASLKDETGFWEFYVDYDYLPLKELDGTISSVMVTSTDVTDRVKSRIKLEQFSKELEQEVNLRTKQLKIANDQLLFSIQTLERRNEELEAFAYISSHDLQEPLRKIQIFISRIEDKEQAFLSDRGKDYFKIIMNSATRMRTLIDDLLSFSRTNKKENVFETVDLASILEEVLENLSDTITISKAEITSTTLPTVHAVPFQMKQVFTNIVSNAIKFSKKDSIPTITIQAEPATQHEISELQLRSGANYYKISITDNGIGILKGMEEKIFEVFQRAHSEQDFEGTGIGLAIVKKIIANHNGAIYAQSTEGEGTTFTFFLLEEKIEE